jgi:hypothetical protein
MVATDEKTFFILPIVSFLLSSLYYHVYRADTAAGAQVGSGRPLIHRSRVLPVQKRYQWAEETRNVISEEGNARC